MNQFVSRPKISICVATYNQQSYIKDCLLSVLMQDCPADLEIIVGDDCSTDATGAIISEIAAMYPGRLTIPRRVGNLGATENYQDMINRASGDFIAHIDGDDYWMPGKLAAQLTHFTNHPSCIAVYSNAHVIDDCGRLIGTFNNAQPESFDTGYLLDRGNFLNHSSMMYRSNFRDCILELTGNFIDYRMHLRLSRNGLLGYVNKDLVAYRCGTTTSMIKHVPRKVNDLYWEAITDPEIPTNFQKNALSAQVYFVSHILYNAVRKNRLPYARYWISKVRAEVPERSALILFRGALLIFPIFWRSARRKVATLLTGHGFYPLYER